MGTLGQYLRSARESKDIDLRDAAQQTRIGLNYLKALEDEDFSKLPGEVFVKGFLKNYSRFLKLDEAETLAKYAELRPKQAPAAAGSSVADPDKKSVPAAPESASRETPVEPFVWGAVITISLLVLLFTALPVKRLTSMHKTEKQQETPVASGDALHAQLGSDKLYLEVVAMDDTWLLVRTDTSPQKKAVLKKGESLIWSASDRFLLSYGKASALKLLLNGEELSVRSTADAPVRDLTITHTGILNQPLQAPLRPKPRPSVPVVQTNQANQATQPHAAQQHPKPRPADPVAQPNQTSEPVQAQPAPQRLKARPVVPVSQPDQTNQAVQTQPKQAPSPVKVPEVKPTQPVSPPNSGSN